VALVAVEDGAIVGGGRYIVDEQGRPRWLSSWQIITKGHGIGAALMRHLAAIARQAGLKEMTADVLPDNISMMKVFEKSGLPLRTTRGSGLVRVTLQLL
jgi:GNAT superfamily N-acetyltransferase